MEMGSFIISKVGKWEQHSKNKNDSIPNWKTCTNYTGNGICNWMLPADDPSDLGCVAKFFKIRDNARFLAIEKPND